MNKSIKPVILAVIQHENKVLLTLRKESDSEDLNFNDYWQIPGGGLEFGESVEECAVREAKEELSLDIEVLSLIPKIYHDVRGDWWHGLLIGFNCRSLYPESLIILNEEASDYGWFTVEEAKKLKMMPYCLEILEASLLISQ